jgi:REP element-mobilizing transposase RayT
VREASERNGYRIYALAVMPDDVHVVVDAGKSQHAASKVLNNLKGVSARRLPGPALQGGGLQGTGPAFQGGSDT